MIPKARKNKKQKRPIEQVPRLVDDMIKYGR